MITLNKWWQLFLLGMVVLGLSALALMAIAAALIYPTLPSLDVITDYQPKLPLRIFSEEGILIGEFGQERRAYVKIESVPKIMKDAVLAIEDRRFYQHNGIDTKGILRAIKNNVTGRSHEGASTITMQVAKNFFTTPNGRRTISTKINEALLAIKIERNLTKNKILELYLNQIYLGQRSYGFAAASRTYFGKSLSELTLAEAALLAGLPKAPSGYNPFVRPDRAMTRQREVLRDMQRFGFIDEATYAKASKETLTFKSLKVARELSADYVAEIVRDALYQKYKDDIYVNGLQVYTTIRKNNQHAANLAVRDGLVNYDFRHGFRGPEKHLELAGKSAQEMHDLIVTTLNKTSVYGGLIPSVVTKVTDKTIEVITKNQQSLVLRDKGIKLVSNWLKTSKTNAKQKVLKIGDVIRVVKRDKIWTVVQVPAVQAALVSLDPKDGAVRALVGGFDFKKSKFNHATQAWRQPGSSFKPFVYSAALEKGYTPATIVEDEPLEYTAGQTGDEAWSPQNYDHKFRGPIRLRVGLTNSVNTIAIRMLDDIGVSYAQDYITRFGFSKKNQPAYLTMALGAGSTTSWEMAGGYAVFANGGYRVQPYIISKILDQNGHEVFSSKAPEAGVDAQQVIDQRNAFLMHSMLRSVVTDGTAKRALNIGRKDIVGKTGTTNDHFDAWFAGYSPKQVAIVWLGYDQPQSLGRRETGGGATLPIWIQYMKTALKGLPDEVPAMPEGVVKINIDPLTGVKDASGIAEYFYVENPPPEYSTYDGFFKRDDEAGYSGNLLEMLQDQARKLLAPTVPAPQQNQTQPQQPQHQVNPMNGAPMSLPVNPVAPPENARPIQKSTPTPQPSVEEPAPVEEDVHVTQPVRPMKPIASKQASQARLPIDQKGQVVDSAPQDAHEAAASFLGTH